VFIGATSVSQMLTDEIVKSQNELLQQRDKPLKLQRRCPHMKLVIVETIRYSLELSLFWGWVAGFLGLTEQGNRFWKDHFKSHDGMFGKPYKFISETVHDFFRPFTDPDKDVLLPDMPPPPPGHVPMRTLVLDLEGTLCHSEWDAKYGWRTAKRPGVDKFLMRLAGMYEIVLFTSGPYMSDQPIVMQLDQYGCISHQLYRHSTAYMGNRHVKDISKLNRDLSKVIVVDDKPEEVCLQPENVVRIKPFVDVNASDMALEQLLPFLEDLVMRDVPDVREEIKKYGGDDIGETFMRRMIAEKRRQEEQRSKGLGGLIRKRAHQPAAASRTVGTSTAAAPTITSDASSEQEKASSGSWFGWGK